MAATAAQTRIVRSWVGTAADLSDLDALLDELATPEAVALQLLRQQYADLLARPTKLGVDGDVTADWSANVNALAVRIKSLEAIVSSQPAPGGLSTGTLVVTPLVGPCDDR